MYATTKHSHSKKTPAGESGLSERVPLHSPGTVNADPVGASYMAKLISDKKRKLIYNKYDGRCAYCGNRITYQEMEPDHIIPKSRGGSNDVENLNPSCKLCNSYKASLTLDEFAVKVMNIQSKIFKNYHFRVAHNLGILKVNIDSYKYHFHYERVK